VSSSIGFLTQATRPGERTVYYRVDDDAWARVVQRQVASLTSLGAILRDGIGLVGGPSERAERLRVAHEVFAWLDNLFAEAPPPPTTQPTTHPDAARPPRKARQ
jgi:hypothetical protein